MAPHAATIMDPIPARWDRRDSKTPNVPAHPAKRPVKDVTFEIERLDPGVEAFSLPLANHGYHPARHTPLFAKSIERHALRES